MDKRFLDRADLQCLYDALTKAGYKVIGPQAKDGAIVFSHLKSVDGLPWGTVERVKPGSYTLEQEHNNRCFNWNTGPQLLKPWLFKPQELLWHGEESDDGIRFKQAEVSAEPLAFIGLRACDIAALYLQDKHFLHGEYPDPWYSEQRHKLCLVAVNCSQSAETCFCVSTGDGPEVTFGFDVLLDEVDEGYLVQSKSDKGDAVVAELPLMPSNQMLEHQARQQLAKASVQTKVMPDAKQLAKLTEHLNAQQWQDIAQRCFACGNCTLVCPTCFCSKQESEMAPENGAHQQVRYWDSCFSEKHSYIAGKHIRGEISQRYRQWMLHKLATWQDQYGRSGCVGCGRCISWCPAAIDIVQEASIILGGEAHE